MDQLVDAVVDFGDHLRRNTEVVHSVAMDSAQLAAEVSELRQAVARLSMGQNLPARRFGEPVLWGTHMNETFGLGSTRGTFWRS